MPDSDYDLDLLRDEARTARTPTRRAWAQRLVERIERLEGDRGNLTRTFVYSTTPSPDVSENSPAPPD